MADLVAVFEGMQAHLAAHPFRTEEWNCSEEELLAMEKRDGEQMAHDWIALAKKRYSKTEHLVRELKFWCGMAGGFPASGIHAFPLLIDEIKKLEG